MNGRRIKFLWLAAAGLWCITAPAGCGEQAVEPVALDVKGVQAAADYSDLAAVLRGVFVTKRSIRRHRFINPQSAKELADRLNRQLARLAVTGPTATPQLFHTPEAKLAYWYNARAAWALKLAMLQDFPPELSRRRLYSRQFRLDGRLTTLEQIDATLASDSDWRTLVAAPCVTLQRAGLPAEPFGPGDIRQRIAERLGEFIDDDERLLISVARKCIYVPAVLWRFEGTLRKSHDDTYGTEGSTLTTGLLPYVSGSPHRRLQDAVGYRCVPDAEGYKLAIEANARASH